MIVGKFMTPKDSLVTLTPDKQLKDVIEIFEKYRIGCVIITDEEKAKPVGIITKTDLIKLALPEPCDSSTLIRDIMSTKIVTVSPQASRNNVASVMSQHEIHHAVITSDEGNLLGLTSAWDVAREVRGITDNHTQIGGFLFTEWDGGRLQPGLSRSQVMALYTRLVHEYSSQTKFA